MLVLANSAQAYFREALENALRRSNISVTESAQVYVVHLLTEFSRTENAFSGSDYGESTSIAELLERASQSGDREALRIYRHLGDTSLYLLGFFKESKENRIVSVTYYKDMGATAYSYASDISRAYTVRSSALFQELSERFNEMVMVLEMVAKYRAAAGQ